MAPRQRPSPQTPLPPTRATGTADSVCVRVNVPSDVVIHHSANRGNVEAASSNVRGDHNAELLLLEPRNASVSRPLVHVPVQQQHWRPAGPGSEESNP